MEEVLQMLRAMHISGKYKGAKFLGKAVEIIAKDESAIFCVSKLVYPVVAQQFHTTADCVERDIRTVIETCWRVADPNQLSAIMGHQLNEKPTTKEMLEAMSSYVRKLYAIKEKELGDESRW